MVSMTKNLLWLHTLTNQDEEKKRRERVRKQKHRKQITKKREMKRGVKMTRAKKMQNQKFMNAI